MKHIKRVIMIQREFRVQEYSHLHPKEYHLDCIKKIKNKIKIPVKSKLQPPPMVLKNSSSVKHYQVRTYPNITAFQSIILLSQGAPLMPAGGSCCNRLKSLINRFLAGVDILTPYNQHQLKSPFHHTTSTH